MTISLFLGLSSFSLAAFADDHPTQGISSKEYGKLYVVEQREQSPHLWRVGAGTAYEFGNPYLHVQTFNQSIERSVNRFVWVGIQLTEFTSTSTALMNALRQELNNSVLGINAKTPRLAASAMTTFVPLSGHLSFLGDHPLAAELSIRVGAGAVSYEGEAARLMLSWSLRPMFHLDQHFSIQFGFGQEIESPFSSDNRIARFRGDLGLSYRF